MKPLYPKLEWLRSCGFGVQEQHGGFLVWRWAHRKWKAWRFEGNPSWRRLRAFMTRHARSYVVNG